MQRRRNMPPRSPIICWLLIAATLSADAVVFTWMAGDSSPRPFYATVAFYALLLSQVSVVCIWSVLRSESAVWSRVAPLLAVLAAAAAAMALVEDSAGMPSTLVSHLAIFGFHAAMLVAALWLLQRTSFWRRRSGVALAWRYSTAQLLILTTVVAVLGTLLRSSTYLGEGRWLNLFVMVSCVALAVAAVLIWTLAWHWLLRLAALSAFAILLAAALLPASDYAFAYVIVMGDHYLIQAAVLSAWLAWGPILPPRPAANEP